MEIQQLHNLFLKCGRVTTDSRNIQKGDMFIALRGERFDGNLFALKALEDGASFAVVDSDSEAAQSGDERVIAVEDTFSSLTDLGRYHREHVLGEGKRLTVIGLTGTNGKTTTKELIREVLSKKYKVVATEGNLNNDIGVPLSLLKIKADTELAVIEMGANHPDDIEKLVDVCHPDFGLITNVGRAHLLGFGSFEGVKKAKGALYDYIAAHGKAVFVNADDADLVSMASERQGLSTIPYGVRYWNAIVLPSNAAHPYLSMAIPENLGCSEEKETLAVLESSLVGSYNSANVCAAVAVGSHFGVSLDDIIAAIESYTPSNNRSQMVKTASNMLIVDAYNANPTSMSAALDNFMSMESASKVALLGNMGELGEDSFKEHVALVQRLLSMSLSRVCLVGEEFKKALDSVEGSSSLEYYSSSALLAEELSKNGVSDSLVLVKGSRSTAMEKVLPVL